MIKLLVVNGCSLTRGKELDEPDAESWPALLSNRFGIGLVNLARNGGSNRRVVRTTVMAMSDVCKKQGVDAEEVLFLGLWTDLQRHEYFVNSALSGALWPDDERWRTIGPWMIGIRPWMIGIKDRSPRLLYRQFNSRAPRAFYHRLWTEEGQRVSFLLDWVMLDAFLVSRGYKARYAFGQPFTMSGSDASQRLAAMIDHERVYGGLDVRHDSSFMGLTSEMPTGPETHPLTAGHETFSLALADWLADDPSLALSSPERGGS